MKDNNFDRVTVCASEKPMDDVKNIPAADTLSLEEQEALRFGKDTRHREVLVYWMMTIVSLWLISVLLFAVFNNQWNLNISDNVLITLLATTTLNVLGLSKIILSGLFRPVWRKRSSNKNKE